MRVSLAVTVLVFFLVGMVFAMPLTSDNQGFTQFSKRTNTGDATFYYQGGAYGSCGVQNSDSAMIVALSNTYCGEYMSPYCGKCISITAVNGPTPGASVKAVVADTCEGCQPQDVDCSIGVFNALFASDQALGRGKCSWEFVPC